jgi:hypothetical protein
MLVRPFSWLLVLIAKWFRQEVGRTCLYDAHAHRYAAMACDEDDRDHVARCIESKASGNWRAELEHRAIVGGARF